MRITARPARATRVIEVGAAPSAPPGAPPPPGSGRAPPDAPRSKTASGARRPWLLAVAVVIAASAGVAYLVAETSTGPPSVSTGSPTPTGSVTESRTGGPSDSATPSGSVSATPTGTGDVPSQTPTATSVPSGSATPPTADGTGASDVIQALSVAAAVVLGALLLYIVMVRRRRPAPAHGWQPVRRLGNAALPAEDRPRASLGTPDVLVLTPTTTDDDGRLRDHLAQESSAIFANLQLACSFQPAKDWIFTGAKLTVVLARADGRAAPAPIAYSLRPLSEMDGTARENNVEIGADVKFVNAKVGEKSTRGGEVFVRGYGLQESTSFWEFTPTRARPLEGSFWLWLIAKAPLETDLAITSSLLVQVSPRRWRWRAAGPPAEGTGSLGLVLHLKDGPPYRTDPVDESELKQHVDGA